MSWSTGLSEAQAGAEPSSHKEEEPPELKVVVLGATSPLDSDSLFGRGHGVLVADRSVTVTFLIGHQDFVKLRDQVLGGVREISLAVRAVDVTAVDMGGRAPRDGPLP